MTTKESQCNQNMNKGKAFVYSSLHWMKTWHDIWQKWENGKPVNYNCHTCGKSWRYSQ